MQEIEKTESSKFRNLFSNGTTFTVPKFQRDYSWAEEHWDDLWHDIENVINDDKQKHYLGYLVLQTSDEKNYIVIDGQQRLTTICIIILATLKKFELLEKSDIDQEKNKQRRELFYKTFIGYLDPVTLISSNKLILNRNNNDFFKKYLTPLLPPPRRGINLSDKLLKRCFDWFFEKIDTKYSSGEDLASFIERLVDKLFFTVIKVRDNINANKVFETLNARGVQLSSSDLVKNHLFSIVDSNNGTDHEIKALEDYWFIILDKLGNNDFSEFLRIYWNSRNKTIRKNEIFKTIKNSITSKKQVFDFIRDLADKIDIYIALNSPEDELWKEKNEIKKILYELDLFNVKQSIPLLITAYEFLDDINFIKVLKACSILAFRYNVISGLNPYEPEKYYNKLALYIISKKAIDISILSGINPKDETFETTFANKEFKNSTRNNKIIKYILSKFELNLSGKEIDCGSKKNTLEHILPEHPENHWEHISDEELERCVFRLGNITLLEDSLNKKILNYSIEKKFEIYKQSNFKTTNLIPDNFHSWNEETISKRQKDMAKQAKTIWQLN